MPHDPISPEIAALQAHSEHSQDNRSYLQARLDNLTEIISGPDGLSVRLVRLEERLALQQRAANRRMGWLVPLASVLTLALEALVKALVTRGS